MKKAKILIRVKHRKIKGKKENSRIPRMQSAKKITKIYPMEKGKTLTRINQ